MTDRARSLLPLLLVGVLAVPGAALADEPTGQEPAPADVPGHSESASDEPAPVGQLTPPIALGTVAGQLPDGALAPGDAPVEVIVSIVVDVDGAVLDAELATSSGLEVIDDAAIRTALALRFLPATLDGDPVSVTIDYPVAFVPPPEEPAGPPPAQLVGRVRQVGGGAGAAGAEVALYPAARLPQTEPTPASADEGSGAEQGPTAAPLTPAQVTSADEPLLTLTAAPDGTFDTGDLPAGLYLVTCTHPGHRPTQHVEELGDGVLREVVYWVEPAENESVVRAWQPHDAPRRSLTREELRVVPGASRDPVAALTSLPGVTQVNKVVRPQGLSEQSHAPVLRGSAPEDSVMVLDGLPTPFIYHSIDRFSLVGDDLVESAFMEPAASSARYGDLTGGVLGLDLRSPRADRVGGYVDLGIGRAGFALEGPIGKRARFYVGMRRSYFELFLKLFLPDDAAVDFATAPFFQDQQAIIEVDVTPHLKVTGGYLGSLDGMRMLRGGADPDEAPLFDMDMDLHRFFLRADAALPSGLVNRLHVAVTPWSTEFQVQSSHHYRDKHTTIHVRDDFAAPLLPWLRLQAGTQLEIDILEQRRDTSDLEREDTGPITTFGREANEVGEQEEVRPWLGGWAGLTFEPIEQVRFAPEVRVDWFGSIDQVAVQPRARLGIQALPSLRFSLSGGRYVQSPSFDELNATTGNPDLRAEGAWHLNGGVAWTPASWITIDLQGYGKWLDHQVVSERSTLSFGDFAQVAATGLDDDPTNGLSNDGIGRIFGGELFARFDVGTVPRLNGWVGYTLAWSQRRDGPDEEWRFYELDRRHQFTTALNVTLPGGWLVGARWMIQSGNPYTEIDGATFYANGQQWIPTYGDHLGARREPYHQLDLRMGRRILAKQHIVDVYFEVINVYASRTGGWRFHSFDYEVDEVLFAIPYGNFAVRVEF